MKQQLLALCGVALICPATRAETPVESEAEDATPGGTFTIGAGYADGEGFIATAGLGHRSLLGVDGLELSLDSSLSAYRQDVGLSFDLDPWRHPLSFDFGLHARQRTLLPGYDAVTGSDFGGHLGFGYRLEPGWLLSLSYRAGAISVGHDGALDGVSLAPPAGGWEQTRVLSALRLELRHRSEGAGIDPASPGSGLPDGLDLRLAIERADRVFGSDFQLTRAEVEATYGDGIGGGLRVLLHARAGVLLGEDREIPLFARYRLGGATDPGSALPLLGPRALTDDGVELPLGGRAMGLLRAELDVPLITDVGIYAFTALEAGAVFGGDAPRGQALGAAASAGLLWSSPIGRMRLGWGVPITEKGPEGDPQFLFTLGTGF